MRYMSRNLSSPVTHHKIAKQRREIYAPPIRSFQSVVDREDTVDEFYVA